MSNTSGVSVTPGLVRTFTPLLIGYLATRFGFSPDDPNVALLLGGVLSYAAYMVLRFLEVFASPKWSYVLGLGMKQMPAYAKPPAVVTDESGSRVVGDGGAVALSTLGIALAFGGVLLALAFEADMLGALVGVVGVVLIVLGATKR